MAADPASFPATAGGPSPEPQDLLPNRAFSERARAPGRDFEPEPPVAGLGTAGNAPNDHLVAGIALQRLLPTLTAAKPAADVDLEWHGVLPYKGRFRA